MCKAPAKKPSSDYKEISEALVEKQE